MTRVSWFCVGALVPSMLLAAVILAGVAHHLLGAALAALLPLARARVSASLASLRRTVRRAPVANPAPAGSAAPALAARLSHA